MYTEKMSDSDAHRSALQSTFSCNLHRAHAGVK